MNKIRKISLAHKIAQTAFQVNQSLSSALKIFDIAPEQRVILEVIGKNNKISQNELSLYLGKDKTTVSRTLDVIEKKGYISRKYTKEDKRIKFITLTSLGEEILDKTCEIINLYRKSSIENFSEEEIDTAFYLLEKLSDNIKRINHEK
jgi:DNA-binding MarR family transcriptional regulator